MELSSCAPEIRSFSRPWRWPSALSCPPFPREPNRGGGTAFRKGSGPAVEDPPALGGELCQDRRFNDRNHHQDRRLVLSLPDALVPGLEPRAIRKGRQGLGQVRKPALRHRAVQIDKTRAARTRRTFEERGLLEQEADSEGRQADPDSDAGSADANQRAVGGASRSDRNPGPRCGAATKIGGDADRR